MKRHTIFTLMALMLGLSALAQDYRIMSVEHLPNDMTARKTMLTEKIDGGLQCAVLRISTKNILERQRDAFQFECDLGSVIRERRKDGGEICLWVSPGIKILKIKHNVLGNYILNISEMLKDNVKSLNTYHIKIEGLKEQSEEPPTTGTSQVIFLPSPKDATLYLNNDSIGTGGQIVRSISGKYIWTLKHPLYHTKSGEVTFVSGRSDTLEIALDPSYGYLKIIKSLGFNDDSTHVFIDGKYGGTIPFLSEKLSQGNHNLMLEKNGQPIVSKNLNIKELKTLQISQRSLIGDESHYTYQPLTGKLDLRTTIDSVSVSIDGKSFGLTPLKMDSIVIGAHKIVLTKRGCSTITKEILIEENKETKLLVGLTRACVVTIESDAPGDDVFCDNKHIGETPLTTDISFGRHQIVVKRGIHTIEKDIFFRTNDSEQKVTFSFGQLVTIDADHQKSRISVDNKFVGLSPIEFYLSNGDHTIEASKGWRFGKQTVNIDENTSTSPQITVNTKIASPSSFISNGSFFFTGNIGFVTKDNPTFGLSIGGIGRNAQGGWFLYLSASPNYKLFTASSSCDENGLVNGVLPLYANEKSSFRASAIFGGTLRVGGPVFIRLGAGWGTRLSAWKTTTNNWIILEPYSWKNFEFSAGLQCCIYNFVLTFDALAPLDVLITKKKLVEFRFGFGANFKHKKK